MNPIAAAAIADQAGKQIENGNIERIVRVGSQPMKWVLIAVGVVAALYFANRWIKKYKAEQDRKAFNAQDIVNNPTTNAQKEQNRKAYANTFANMLRSAFNPSGISWLIATDTTNTKAVLSIAEQMKAKGVPYSYVANAYFTAYNDDLAKRLQSELSTSDLQKFNTSAGMAGMNGFLDILIPKTSNQPKTIDYYA